MDSSTSVATHFYAVKVRKRWQPPRMDMPIWVRPWRHRGSLPIGSQGLSAAPVLVSPRARRAPRSGRRQDDPLVRSRGICSPRREVAENVLRRRPLECIAFRGEQRGAHTGHLVQRRNPALSSSDVAEPRRQMEDAAFRRERLQTAVTRLRERFEEVRAQEEDERRWVAYGPRPAFPRSARIARRLPSA
jgi:hypothetical protein